MKKPPQPLQFDAVNVKTGSQFLIELPKLPDIGTGIIKLKDMKMTKDTFFMPRGEDPKPLTVSDFFKKVSPWKFKR